MSTIAAGTTTGTALVSTGDTSGTLQLQVNGTTPALTLNTAQAVGVGSSPSYGTSGQVLTSQGNAAAPVWATPATGGMTLIIAFTPANGTASVAVGSLPSYKSIIAVSDGISLSGTSGLGFAVSSDNGSTYSTPITFTNTNGATPAGFVQVYRTDNASSNKPGFTVNSSVTAAYQRISTVTGTVNLVQINCVTGGITFTGTGSIYIYGMN